MGLLGGRVVGPIGGAIITIPALIFHEWLAHGHARAETSAHSYCASAFIRGAMGMACAT